MTRHPATAGNDLLPRSLKFAGDDPGEDPVTSLDEIRNGGENGEDNSRDHLHVEASFSESGMEEDIPQWTVHSEFSVDSGTVSHVHIDHSSGGQSINEDEARIVLEYGDGTEEDTVLTGGDGAVDETEGGSMARYGAFGFADSEIDGIRFEHWADVGTDAYQSITWQAVVFAESVTEV